MPTATTADFDRPGTNLVSTDSTKMAPSEVLNKQVVLSKAAQNLLDIEAQYTVGGFTPLPGFMDSGKGALLWVSKLKFFLIYQRRKVLGGLSKRIIGHWRQRIPRLYLYVQCRQSRALPSQNRCCYGRADQQGYVNTYCRALNSQLKGHLQHTLLIHQHTILNGLSMRRWCVRDSSTTKYLLWSPALRALIWPARLPGDTHMRWRV